MTEERAARLDADSSFRTLYERHVRDLHAYASRRLGRDLADDVVAETFRRAFEHRGRFDPALGSERGWLFGIATNVIRRHRRTELRRMAALARSDAPSANAGGDPLLAVVPRLDASREIGSVLDAVARLSPDDHDLLVLVAWEGLSSAEVAEALGIPRGTVRSRLHRIRQQLDRARSDR